MPKYLKIRKLKKDMWELELTNVYNKVIKSHPEMVAYLRQEGFEVELENSGKEWEFILR